MYERTDSHNERGAYQSVYGLDVLPEYRGRGLAHKLMAQLIDQAKKEGRKGVTLTCLDEKIDFTRRWASKTRASPPPPTAAWCGTI